MYRLPSFLCLKASVHVLHMCCFGYDRAQLANDVMFMFLYIMQYIFHLLTNTDQGIYIGNRIVCQNIHKVSDVFHIMHVASSSSPLALHIYSLIFTTNAAFYSGSYMWMVPTTYVLLPIINSIPSTSPPSNKTDLVITS